MDPKANSTSSPLREPHPRARLNPSALMQSAAFIREHWPKLLAISAIVLVPCFWHHRIEAGDLASHTYNAWLAQLIHHGQAPGLYVVWRWSNVLFDLLLSGLASLIGLHAAERTAVSLAVLLFFWGAFAFVCAATRRIPWFLLPLIAVITYGWTFEMGFLNYYLSLGLSFFGLAIFWRGTWQERLLALALAPLILLAHPLGVAWCIGAVVYIGIAEYMPRRYQLLLLLATAAGLFFVHHYLWRHFIVEAQDESFYRFNGSDQLSLYGSRYKVVEGALIAFFVLSIGTDVIRRRRDPELWGSYAIPLELYIIALAGAYLLPTGIRLQEHLAPLALLSERLTSVSAVIACCLLGAMRARKWHAIALASIAVAFFAFLYQDTATVNRMEVEVGYLVNALPPNQRVMATIFVPDESRVLVQHIVDRACIGHCFSYGNYEPASNAFRVRAVPGNPYNMTDYELTSSMEEGTYTVLDEDLPAYQVYQCSPDWTKLCIRPLEADEDNDSAGVHLKE
jgi:hypothetical protein